MGRFHVSKGIALAAAALAVLSTGCDKDSKASADKDSKAAAGKKSSLVVKLLDPGQEPRQPLRYKLSAGTKDKMVMAMDMDMTMTMSGMPGQTIAIPTMVMTMDMAISDKVSDSEVRYQFELSDVGVRERPGAMAGTADMLQSQLRNLIGMKGSAVVNARGINRDASLELPESLDPQMKQMMSGTMQNMEQLSAPFPEEAVGKGATWELHQTIAQNGMKIDQVVTYELLELDGDKGTMKATVVQTAGRQKVEIPNMGSADAELLNLASKGSGTTSFDLNKLVPTSNLALTSDYSMTVSAMGQKQEVSAHLEMKVDISSK